MSFLWEMGKLAFQHQLRQKVVEAQLAKSASVGEAERTKPILPFTLDDIVGKDGTHG